jgi:hypothetical protein
MSGSSGCHNRGSSVETRRESKSSRVVKQTQCSSDLDLVEPPQDVPKVSPVILERRER